jgi:hypothetical protein
MLTKPHDVNLQWEEKEYKKEKDVWRGRKTKKVSINGRR